MCIIFASYFTFPAVSLWCSPFLARFLCIWPFPNPTIYLVTFDLRGWFMLGVFLLLAFTYLGHECQDVWVCEVERMCAQTRPWLILSSERVFGEWSQKPCQLQRQKSPLPETQRRVEPATLRHAGQRAQHTTDWAIVAGTAKSKCALFQCSMITNTKSNHHNNFLCFLSFSVSILSEEEGSTWNGGICNVLHYTHGFETKMGLGLY